jgi:predicted nucleotidyltransferase
MISAEHIIKFLSEKKPELERRFGVRRIGLYGSFATGTPDENSDIDILVELKEPKFDYLAGLQAYLEEAFGRKVDIRRISASIRTPFAQRVEKEALYA